MSIVYTFGSTVKVPGLATLPADAPITVQGDYAVELEVAVPAGSVSLEIDIAAVTKSKIVAFALNADKAALNVFTNAADGTGGQEFVLAKNASQIWHNQLNLTLFPNPISSSTITKFYLNNPGTVDAVFRVGFLMNA